MECTRKEIGMYKVSVMYPNQKGSRFDLEYYRTTHMALVEKHMKPFGLLRAEILRGISGGILRADIPNFTDVTPIRQISEVLTIG